jgi:hypothetical protein
MDVCHSCTLLGIEKQKHIDNTHISRVGKSRHWSSELRVLHKENVTDLIISVRTSEYIRVKLTLLALDSPVTGTRLYYTRQVSCYRVILLSLA